MADKIKSFRDLKIWQLGIEIVEDIYKDIKKFPPEELYALSAQMRRSVVSMPSNIAEGFQRRHNKEYRQFLYISLGSAAELETHIEIAVRIGYLSDERKSFLLEKIDHFSRMTMALLKRL